MEIPISYALVQIKEILAPILSNALRYGIVKESVCFPYKFTLLSNICLRISSTLSVCFPYEFTLLSNGITFPELAWDVCFPCEFTLLSNSFLSNPGNPYVCFPYEFTLLSNLKSSKNNILPNTRVPS